MSNGVVTEALEFVKDASLQEWINRWFDLLLEALDALEAKNKGGYYPEAIKRCKAEIVISCRIDQLPGHEYDAL